MGRVEEWGQLVEQADARWPFSAEMKKALALRYVIPSLSP
jgi:hypothetical protein